MADEILIKEAFNLVAEIKDMDMRKGIVTGYAASFNTVDADGDTIIPGAFTKTIKEQGPESSLPRIKHLLNHDRKIPVGKPLLLKEDARGLYYESQAGTHAQGADFLKMVDSGLITEHSIGYGVVRKVMQKGARQLHELKLMEFSSLTAWGVNKNTPITGIKSLQSIDCRIDNLVKAIKNGTFTDSAFEFLAEELLYLQKAFKDISTKSEPEATTSPDMKGFADTLKSFHKSLKN